MKTYTVYKYTNTVTGKYYIGCTSRPVRKRWIEHLSDAKHDLKQCRLFHEAIRGYGEGSWEQSNLFVCHSKSEALDMEEYCITTLKSNDPTYGYNIAPGGKRGNTGIKMPPEVGKAISLRQRGENNPSYGRVYTESERLAQSKRSKAWHRENPHPNLGKKAPEGTRRKMSIAHKGDKNHFYGKTHTAESKAKMSKNNGCNGLWGWRNPLVRNNPVLLSIYKRADILFEWWLYAGAGERGSGADAMCTHFGESRTKAHINMVSKFKTGWVPTEDKEWLDFKDG